MKPLALQSFLMPPLSVGANFLSDNLVVSYSPFSNANKINKKWYVNAKIACIYFEFFCRRKKRIWQENAFGSEVTTREGNELVVQKENCVVEEIKEVELRSRRGKFIYNRTYNFIGLNQVSPLYFRHDKLP